MASDFWQPAIHADRRPLLLARNRVKAALQSWFAEQGFVAVECGAVQTSPGNETHLHAFACQWQPEGGDAETRYLHTSPEFAAKKLLAAGETRIVDFARVWRNREAGPLHAPEFTMIEWYRTHADWTDVMADAVALCRTASAAAGRDALTWRGRVCVPGADPELLTLTEAFDRFAGLDLVALLGDRDALAAATAAIGITIQPDDDWSDLFSKIVVTRIEPHLGHGRLTLLTEYPIAEAALARPGRDPRFAERFELYACGVELANGFGELTDAAEQRRRFVADMDAKARLYGERYPIDEDFLAALTLMPPASGVALGFERLALLATGGVHINDMIWTPFPL
jgi:lysyl-tRNA synthetase class 2